MRRVPENEDLSNNTNVLAKCLEPWIESSLSSLKFKKNTAYGDILTASVNLAKLLRNSAEKSVFDSYLNPQIMELIKGEIPETGSLAPFTSANVPIKFEGGKLITTKAKSGSALF